MGGLIRMMTLNNYMDNNTVPFFSSLHYAPYNDSTFVDTLNE